MDEVLGPSESAAKTDVALTAGDEGTAGEDHGTAEDKGLFPSVDFSFTLS